MVYCILFIDDEESLLKLYRAEFEDIGYIVYTAKNGIEAKNILNGNAIHAIVLDIKLENENGLNLLQDIARSHINIPVIISTAHSAYINDFSSWMAQAYVVKSSNLDELQIQLSTTINRNYGDKVAENEVFIRKR